MAMFHLLKIRTSIDIFKNEKCKVTFGLEYSSIGKLKWYKLAGSLSKLKYGTNKHVSSVLEMKWCNQIC